MANKPIDISGKRYGRLVATIATGRDKNRHVIWECVCDCGNVKNIAATSLVQGYTLSCGCYYLEVRGKAGKTHGLSTSKIYRVYRGMLDRCNNPTVERHKHYGGRGIKVCDRWMESFENFYEDMFPTYSLGLSLDRINVNGDYDLMNCRWATAQVQSNNKRNNRVYTIGSRSLNLENWASLSGTNKRTIYTRLQRGWHISKAVYGPPIKDMTEISEYLCH